MKRLLGLSLLLALIAGCGTTPPKQDAEDEMAGLPATAATSSSNGKSAVKPVAPPEAVPPPVAMHETAATNTPPVPSINPPMQLADPQWRLAPPTAVEHYALSQSWVPLHEWCLANHFSEPKRIASPEGAEFSFTCPGGTVVIQIGNRVATWNGVSIYLGFAPILIGGAPQLAGLDIRKNFEPLLGMAYTHHKGNVIVIDPGHGGTDTGTRNVANNHSEKEFTLDWALRLKPLLVAQGWKVYLTRTNDVALKLPDRVALADAVRADVFLSLHFNSAYPETTESGLETYCIPSRGMPSNLTRGSPDIVSIPLPNNAFDAENLLLAEKLHRSVLRVNGHQDRGVRRARFLGVLKWQQRPAVLMEGGYLSNPVEARKIADPQYRQQLANAVAAVLKPEINTSSFITTGPRSVAPVLATTAPFSNSAPVPTLSKGIAVNPVANNFVSIQSVQSVQSATNGTMAQNKTTLLGAPAISPAAQRVEAPEGENFNAASGVVSSAAAAVHSRTSITTSGKGSKGSN